MFKRRNKIAKDLPIVFWSIVVKIAHTPVFANIFKEIVRLSKRAALETKYSKLKNALTTKIDSFRFLLIDVEKIENEKWSEAMSRSHNLLVGKHILAL